MIGFDSSQLALAAPLLVVLGGGVFLLLLEAFAGHNLRDRGFLMPLTVVICAIAFALEAAAWSDAGTGSRAMFSGMLTADRLSIFMDCVFLISAALSAMLAAGFMREHRFELGELYPLILFATGGMMILGAATDLVTIFLGIETMSIAVYVLTGTWRRQPKSSEAAMKYYLNGAFSTAILLYGMALVYGAAGTTSLAEIGEHATRFATQPIFILGMLLLLVGLGFKIAAVPFHMWAADAYEGAPSPVSAFMSTGVKAAAFVTILRLFGTAFATPALTTGAAGWATILGVVAVATMTLGNLAALRQENVKRMLAFSSVAHAGYLLIGVVAMGVVGAAARGPVLYYLLAYTFTTVGAFGVVAWLGNRGDERLQIDDWAGLAQRHPAAALAMTIFMLSLGGVPPTAGFFGKFYIFRAALDSAAPGMVTLVVIAVLNSVVSVAYYLRVVTAMYFREVGREPQPIRSRGMSLALIIAAVATLAIGILPGWVSSLAALATR